MMASQTQSTKDGSGYTCDFVEQPQALNLFICEICKLVLRYPQITQCCGKNACRPCIEKQAENGAPCPIPGCQNQRVEITFNRDLHHDILKSRVYCSLRESGCEWADALENLEKHQLECPFLEEECQNSCGMKIQRRMVEEHEAICERFSVKCKQCGDLYERRNRSNHMDTCSLRMVKCPFSIVGCTAEVLNKDLQQHFEESLSEHYALVAKQNADMQAEIGENKALAQSKENMKPLLAQSMEVLELNDEVAVAEREMIELQTALEEAQLEFKELEQTHSRASAELQQQISESETSNSIHAIREECDQLELMTKVRCYGPALPFIHPADIVSRPLDCPVTTEEYIPRVSFKIPRFQEERKNDACLCLLPFYSHRRGYKMCLMVYCNGSSNVKGKFASIYIRVLSGEHDKKLNWPLHCKVEIEIQSALKGVPNVKKTIEVMSQSPVPEDRFISHVQTLSGCQRAVCLLASISHEPITCYLMDGCLTIDVVRIVLINIR